MDDRVLVIARALAHPGRLLLLRLLGEEGMGVTAVATAAGISKGTAAHHLRVLVEAGLIVRVEHRGHVRYKWGATRWALAECPATASKP